jgi:hypothetical protein
VRQIPPRSPRLFFASRPSSFTKNFIHPVGAIGTEFALHGPFAGEAA